MSKIVVYYMSPSSPYCYLGAERLVAIADWRGAGLVIKPIDTRRTLPAGGGLPVKQRAPSRQAYRLIELARWRDRLGVPMNIEPACFPVDSDRAAHLIIAAKQAGQDAVGLSIAIGQGTWEQQRDIADPATLVQIASEAGYDGKSLLDAAGDAAVAAEFDANTAEALDAGVFGMPWMAIDGVPYWGQDLLDFVARALES